LSISNHNYFTYFFWNKISHPGKLEKSRVIQRTITTTNKTVIVHSCQLIGPNSLYCCMRTDFKFVRDSISLASDLLHRKKLKHIPYIMKKNPWYKTYYFRRLYKICSHNQQRIIMMRPIGKPYRRKLANEIWSMILPLL
jgi:hypothetical protein